MEIEEVIKQLRKEAESIEPSIVYYLLKMYGIRYITRQTNFYVRVLLVLHKYNIEITSDLFAAICDTTIENARVLLHRLGDLSIVTLIRSKGKRFRYVLHGKFLDLVEEHLNIRSGL